MAEVDHFQLYLNRETYPTLDDVCNFLYEHYKAQILDIKDGPTIISHLGRLWSMEHSHELYDLDKVYAWYAKDIADMSLEQAHMLYMKESSDSTGTTEGATDFWCDECSFLDSVNIPDYKVCGNAYYKKVPLASQIQDLSCNHFKAYLICLCRFNADYGYKLFGILPDLKDNVWQISDDNCIPRSLRHLA